MKDHEVAALVNRLRDIAVEFHDSQQLRERIANEIRPLKREWVGLTDEDRRLVRKWTTYNQYMTASEYAEAVQIETEKALKEKNT